MEPINIAKPLLGQEEKNAVWEVLASGKLAQGEKVAQFESAFARYCGTRHAVAAANGTIAIHLALLAHDIKPGDEIITTPFTFIGTVTPILFCRANPVFADIDKATFNISPSDLKKAVTPKTKALLPVHLFGLPADIDTIHESAPQIPIIEDACQSHGASYKGRRAGSLASCACFSFYPTKNMTTGEGGMITTDNDELSEKLRLLRDHGQKNRYEHIILGYNYRMTDIAAAIGIEQLKKLEPFNEARNRNASSFTAGLRSIDQLQTPVTAPKYHHVFHQYTIRAQNRDSLRDHLKSQSINCGVYYPRLVSENPPVKPFATRPTPIAESTTHEVLSLPVHPGLTRDDVKRVISSIKAFYSKHP